MEDYVAQARVETITSTHEFENLLNLASHSCLRDPVLFDTNLQIIAERSSHARNQQLLHKLGLWPVRNIFDSYPSSSLPLDIEGRFTKLEIDRANKNLREIPAMPLDKEVQDKIEALGKSILDEAFITLGPDAKEKVAEFKNAQTVEAKQAVFEWLNQRIVEIRDKFVEDIEDREIEDSEEEELEINNFFHPARLSPALIGEHPDTRLSPTCLGISILAASFCEKLGVRYMHGGVITPGIRAIKSTRRKLLPKVAKIINQDWKLHAPAAARDKFNEAMRNDMVGYDLNRGFHADVVAEIDDNVWIQIDPNFKSTLLLDNGAQLQEVYEALFESGIRGIEKLVFNDHRPQEGSPTHFINRLVRKSPPVEEIEDFLMRVPLENADRYLINRFFGDFSDKKSKGSQCIRFYIDKYVEMCRDFDPSFEPDADVNLFHELRETIIEYVFEGDIQEVFDITEYLLKCKNDPVYRRKTAEHLKIAPLLAVLKLQSEYAHMVASTHVPEAHTMTEFGLPAYRIGACVLSDFAVNCGDQLPFSFWATYWPSHIIFVEHFDRINGEAQVSYAQTVARKIFNSGLTYNDVYIRVK